MENELHGDSSGRDRGFSGRSIDLAAQWLREILLDPWKTESRHIFGYSPIILVRIYKTILNLDHFVYSPIISEQLSAISGGLSPLQNF